MLLLQRKGWAAERLYYRWNNVNDSPGAFADNLALRKAALIFPLFSISPAKLLPRNTTEYPSDLTTGFIFDYRAPTTKYFMPHLCHRALFI